MYEVHFKHFLLLHLLPNYLHCGHGGGNSISILDVGSNEDLPGSLRWVHGRGGDNQDDNDDVGEGCGGGGGIDQRWGQRL